MVTEFPQTTGGDLKQVMDDRAYSDNHICSNMFLTKPDNSSPVEEATMRKFESLNDDSFGSASQPFYNIQADEQIIESDSEEATVREQHAQEILSEALCKEENKSVEHIKVKRKRCKRKNLAVRADVMNKNVFRAIKRELKDVYHAFIISRRLKKSKLHSQTNLKKFSRHLMSSSLLQIHRDNLDLEKYEKYLNVFLNYCQMKNAATEATTRQMIDRTQEVLYAYSHKKYYEYMGIPEVNFILKSVVLKSGINNFVEKHSILSANRERYIAVITDLFSPKSKCSITLY